MGRTEIDIAAVRHLARALNENPFYRSLVVAAELNREETFHRPIASTLDALVKRYDGPTVLLEVVAREYFGLSKKKAYEYATLNRLPVPAFRCTNSQKAPLLVHVEDLANLLNARRAKARSEWNHSQPD